MVAKYVAAGVPKAKIVVGVQFGGKRQYGGTTTSGQGARFPMDQYLAGKTGKLEKPAEILYCDLITRVAPGGDLAGAQLRRDRAAVVPYYTGNGSPNDKDWVLSFDDPQNFRAKGAWVKAQGCGGALVWQLRGGFVSGSHPLLDALRGGLGLQ